MEGSVFFAFGLTLFAGLSTGIGSLIALFAKTTNKKFLSLALGFSAGVMIYISMVEIIAKARDSFIAVMGVKAGSWMTVAAFFSGMLIIALIDKVIPSDENPHEVHCVEEMGTSCTEAHNGRLMRMGLVVALALGIHNFPEGLATFMAGLQDPRIAVPVAVAIAIHNIPEGISVSVPVFYATGDRRKAFIYSFMSGITEPLGALIGYLILRPFMNEAVFGFVFAAVAGIMVFIALDELLPSAREYGEHHLSIYGLVLGMMVMAVSLLFFL
ncbi:MAG: zinc transporter ZupT [Spirochaetes bacterium]|nr:zinc transporter ZupT [Spirochaetota bacterium]